MTKVWTWIRWYILRRRPVHAGWELHPCTTPSYRLMWHKAGRDGRKRLLSRPQPDGLIGNIWHCWCGRRWRVTGLNAEGGRDSAFLTWELVNGFDEEDFVALEEIANGQSSFE